MNSLIAQYRQQAPDDPRSDEELTWLIGSRIYATPASLELARQRNPDFVTQFEALRRTREEALRPGISEEFGRGLKAGSRSLAATALGAGALAADAVPGQFADPLRDRLSAAARSQEEAAAELAPPGKVEDVKGIEDATRLGLYAAGNVLPSLLEAIGISAAGAVAGSALPGPGTAAGALSGLIGRQAIRSLARRGITQYTEEQLKREAAALAGRYGAALSGALNSYALSSGEIYNELLQRGTDPDVAFNTSVMGGVAAAVPDTFLPAYLVGKYLPGVAKPEAHRFVGRLAREAVTTIPAEAVTEGFQELVNIAATRWADPSIRDTPLSDEERSRILNASVFGAVGGGLAAPLAAFPGGATTAAPTPPPPQVPPPSPVPSILRQYAGPVAPERLDDLYRAAVRLSGNQIAEARFITQLPPDERRAYAVARASIPGGSALTQPSAPAQDPGAGYGDEGYDPELEAILAEAPKTERQVIASEGQERQGQEVLLGTGAVEPAVPPPTPAAVPATPQVVAPEPAPPAPVPVAPTTTPTPVAELAPATPTTPTTPAATTAPLVAEVSTPSIQDVPATPAVNQPDLSTLVDLERAPISDELSGRGGERVQSGIRKYGRDEVIISDGEHVGQYGVLLDDAARVKELESILESQDPDAVQRLTALQDKDALVRLKDGTVIGVNASEYSQLAEIRSQALADDRTQSTTHISKPAFFRVTGDEQDLGEQLTSDHSPAARSRNTDTKRLTFFQSPAGDIVAVPTYATSDKSRGGKTYRVGPLPGASRGGTLEAAIKQGYRPVASLRLKQQVNALDVGARYQMSREAFEALAGPLEQQIRASQSTYEAVASSMAPEATTAPELSGVEIEPQLANTIFIELQAIEEERGAKPDQIDIETVLKEIAINGGPRERQQLQDFVLSARSSGVSWFERIQYAYQHAGSSQEFVVQITTGPEGRLTGARGGQGGADAQVGPGAEPAVRGADQAGAPAPDQPYGSKNKIVDRQTYEAALRAFDQGGTTLGSGPVLTIEQLRNLVKLAVFHIEAGVRKFVDVVGKLIADLPTLKAQIIHNAQLIYLTAKAKLPNLTTDDPQTVKTESARLRAESGVQSLNQGQPGGVAGPVPAGPVGGGSPGGRPGDAGSAPALPESGARGSVDGPRGPDATAGGGFQGDAGRSGSIVGGTPGLHGGATYGWPKRPDLVTASAKLIPIPTEYATAENYPVLDAHQRLGVNLAISRFVAGGPAFMLADGTGVGKTVEEIVIAVEMARRLNLPTLIVTESQAIIDNNFADDAKMLGIDLRAENVELLTYSGIGSGLGAGKQYGLVIFDEAHNLKNPETKKASAGHALKSLHRVYATATPMDNPVAGAYFFADITGQDPEEVAKRLGYRIRVSVSGTTGEIRREAVLLEGVTAKDVLDHVILMRDVAIKQGAMIRREYPMFGTVEEVQVDMPESAKAEQEEIENYWQARIEETVGRARGFVKGQRIQELSRWTEYQKVIAVQRMVIRDLIAGKSVIIMAEGINPTKIKGLGDQEIPGFLSQLAANIRSIQHDLRKINPARAKLLDFVEILGSGDKGEAVRIFQRNEIKLAAATPASGSTGINLDDQIGNAPRVLYMVTANFSGDKFTQAVGRISRRNTQSPAEFKVVTMNGALADIRRREILTAKISTLRAVTSGTKDIDVLTVGSSQFLEDAGQETGEWQEPVNRAVITPANRPGVMMIGDSESGRGTVYRNGDRIRRIAQTAGGWARWIRISSELGAWEFPASIEPQIREGLADILDQEMARQRMVGGIPDTSSPTQVRNAFYSFLQAMANTGVDMAVLRRRLDGIGGALAAREGGAFFGNAIAMTLQDFQAPTRENLVTALHEGVHALLGRETPEVRQALIGAINQMGDVQLGIADSPDPRIRATNPAGLSVNAIMEERTAEAVARVVADRAVARSISNRFWAGIKDLMFRLAIALQRLILGADHVSPRLAFEYVANRLSQMARDRGVGLLDLLAQAKNPASRMRFFEPTDAGGWREPVYNPSTNSLEFRDVLPESVDAMLHNMELGRRRDPGTTIGTAVLGGDDNPGIRMGIDLAANSDIAAAVESAIRHYGQTGKTVLPQVFRAILNLPDGRGRNAELTTRAAQLGIQSPVAIASILDLTGPHQQRWAARKSLRMLRSEVARLSRESENRRTENQEIEAKIEEASVKLLAAQERFRDADLMMSQVLDELRATFKEFRDDFRSNLGNARRLGTLIQQLRRFEELKNKPLPHQYKLVIDRLSAQIMGEPTKFFDVLQAVAVLPIDWPNVSTWQARRAISEAAQSVPELAPLADDSMDAEALTAIVTSFAKNNARLMAMLDLRALRNVSEQAALEQMIKEAAKSVDDDFRSARSAITKAPTLGRMAGKLLGAYQQAKRKNRAMMRRLEHNRQYIDMAKTAIQSMDVHGRALEERLGAVVAPVEVTHGALLMVPSSPQATVEDVESTLLRYELTEGGGSDQVTVNGWIRRIDAWLAANPEKVGRVRNALIETSEALKRSVAHDRHLAITHTVRNQLFGSVSAQAERTGTAAGRSFAQRINRFTALASSFRNPTNARAIKWGAARGEAMRTLGIQDGATFDELVYDAGLAYLSGRRDLEALSDDEAITRASIREVVRFLERSTATSAMMGRPGATQAVERFFAATEQASRHLDGVRRSMGLQVSDDVMGLYRDSIGHPLLTVGRGLSRTIESVYPTMINLGWLGTKIPTQEQLVAGLKQNRDIVARSMAGLLTPEVIRHFVVPMVNRPTRSLFFGTPLGDGVMPIADVESVRTAYEETIAQGAGLVEFGDRLFELEGGRGDRDAFVAETIDTFQQYFAALSRVFQQRLESERSGVPLTPHQIMDARVAEDMPAEWLRHNQFDAFHAERAVTQLAFHAAFGRDGQALFSDADQMVRDLEHDALQLARIEDEVRPVSIGKSKRQVQDLIRQTATAQALDYEVLRSSARHLPLARTARSQIEAWMRSRGSGLIETRLIHDLLHAIAGMAVQGPKTALLNTLSMFDPVIRQGISRSSLRQVATTWQSFMGEALGSLFQTIGITLQHNAEYVERRRRLGYHDPDTVLTLRERIRALMSYGIDGSGPVVAMTRGARAISEGLRTGIGRTDGPFSTLKPLAPFSNAAQWMHAATIDGVWRTYETLADRAVQYLRDNPGATSDPGFQFTAPMLGYSGGTLLDDSRAFNALVAQLQEYGINLERHAISVHATRQSTPSAPLFSDDQYRRLAQIAQNEITLDSNLASRPSVFFTNPVLRFGVPLLSWSFARIGQVGKGFREPDGQRSWAAFRAGMKVMGALVPLGLAYAFLMDEYDELVVGKKSNIRELGESGNILAAIEQLARVGTFGLIGDVANTAANFAVGGDLRGISVDSRVLFLNSTMSLINALGTVARQGGTTTYATVWRPVIQALGGSGYLQYGQILNNALGLDNAEAKVNNRISVQNYLRASGRELGLDVRIGRNQSMPNEMKPWVTEMVLAAISNDAQQFNAAYRSAVESAREMGKQDPTKAVRESFSSYHPLKTVFRTAPTGAEYQRLIGAMGDRGAEDVQAAINLFNAYGQRIGVAPFDGRAAAKPKAQASDFQRAALGAMQGAGRF